jgi:damage-control phosphatase, subfamily III
MPWFVSDVTPSDFAQTISMLQSDHWSIGDQALKVLAERFQQRLDSGVFALSVPLDTKLGEHLSYFVWAFLHR